MRLEKIIPKGFRITQNLQPSTLREFTGGWNILDDDMNLSHKYARIAYNVYADNDGTVAVRQGYRLFAECAPLLSSAAYAVEAYYFNSALIVVMSNGEICKLLGNGAVSVIWSAVIAASLPNAPTGWSSPVDFASFAEFNDHLIVCNGQDKPLDIDNQFRVEYLQDAATSQNTNVPICKYVTAIARYLVMAGDPLEPDRVHISARDAHGTWYGDEEPNDGTRLDVGSILSGATTIRGLLTFRGRLIVMFAEGLLFGELGQYDENGNHTPNFEDGVSGYGSISHRSGIAYGDDGLFMDLEGVPSIKRTALSTSFKPERVSDLVDPAIKLALKPLSFEAMENHVFSVYNRANGQFMLFVPNAETVADTTETRAFVYSYRPSLRQEAWSLFGNWNFTCGVRSLTGRVFFGDKNAKIWVLGSDDDPIYTDNGAPIPFDWELPWLDFGQRTKSKTSKHISFDTRGLSEFDCRMYVDNFYTNKGVDSPALRTEFSGGGQGHFGEGPQPYGGGRNTARKWHYTWPAKFQIAKLRFSGNSDAGLSFVSISLHYLLGGINR
jgi:hypothetical protein